MPALADTRVTVYATSGVCAAATAAAGINPATPVYQAILHPAYAAGLPRSPRS